ncbi:hypothetical protein [Actinomadura rugatobispora]|uniref:WXG100 family type VII secretion target n=1 Tax=Actinomadura rugatobispora TaxID=1994 RepID=A0ABW1A312_9ACTN
MDELTGQVNKLLGYQSTVKYSGRSAEAFRTNYGQDALMMAGLNKIINAAAGIIDALASRLAMLEQRIENALVAGRQAGYFAQDDNVHTRHAPTLPDPPPIGSVTRMDEWHDLRRRCLADAEKSRVLAAAQLSKLADALMEGLNYYKGQRTVGTLDPNGLLRKGQVDWYSPRIEELRKKLEEGKGDLNLKGSDANTVLKDMKAIGGGASAVGDAISGIPHPAAQGTGGAVSAVGGVLTALSGVGEHFSKK